MQQPPPQAAPPAQDPSDPGISSEDAPPKQVAMAMERLSRAARLIADVRLGADHLLEALFMAADAPHNSNKTIQLILKEESSMLQHFQDLRNLDLEAWGEDVDPQSSDYFQDQPELQG